jgi:5-(carboxyamino)imidazole ribonucleotide mutase
LFNANRPFKRRLVDRKWEGEKWPGFGVKIVCTVRQIHGHRGKNLPSFLRLGSICALTGRSGTIKQIMSKSSSKPQVGILMGSDSDWPVMKSAADTCAEFGVLAEARVISAHRTPNDLAEYATGAHERGMRVIIAGAGGAAHLPGVTAALTPLPVIGVPIESKALKGLDSLLSIVQMPSGIPVATVAIGGARNAGLLAVQILAVGDDSLRAKFLEFKSRLADESRAKNRTLQT